MASQHSPLMNSGAASIPLSHANPGRRHYYLSILGGFVILGCAVVAEGAGVQPVRQPVSADQSVAASQRNVPSSDLIRKTRLEFNKLGLQMVGMTSIMNEATALIQFPGAKEPMFCTVGQVVGGFKIISIQSEYTVFEGNGIRIWLALGTEDITSTVVGGSPDASEDDRKESEDLKTYYRNGKPVAAAGVVKNVREEIITYNGKTVSASTLSSGGSPQFMVPMPGRVTSNFGYRQQPTGGARKYHRGVDIQGKIGTPIAAAADGVVEEVSRSWAKGLNILIRHANGHHTAYFHLSKTLVKEGQSVKQGTTIGLMGNTGITTGPHLHFEIHKNGVAVDPSMYLKSLRK